MSDPGFAPSSRLPRASTEQLRLLEAWKSMSGVVHHLRHTGIPTASNAMLRAWIEQDKEALLAPLCHLWIADNHAFAGQPREAISAYRELADRHPKRSFCGQAFGAIALEQAALCHERLGQPAEAIAALREIPERFGEACYPGWVAFRIGLIAERTGDLHTALDAFGTAAATNDPANAAFENYRDRARRNVARLKSDRAWIRPSAEALIAELVGALRDADADRLKRLASPTHFSIGMLFSECCLVETGELFEQFAQDLGKGSLAFPEGFHRTDADKIMVPTEGWQGGFLSGPVFLQVNAAPGGYEWGGIALTRVPPTPEGFEAFTRFRPRSDPETGGRLPGDHREPPWQGEAPRPPLEGAVPTLGVTVADLAMKCPWPRGTEFYAGGLIELGVRLAVFDAPLLASTALAVPVFGPLISGLILTAAGTAAPFVATKLLLDFQNEFPCGLGAGGLYYNQLTTHVGSSRFAVDFATFFPGVILPVGSVAASVYVANNATLGQPVLAVTDGIVTSVTSSVARGADPGFGNQVTMDLVTTKEERAAVAAAFFIALFTGTLPPVRTKFSAFYLHLDGPALVPVSLGMFVRQGARLGRMDDTGLSQAHHLHFELRDNATGITVRPTPMDGQTLEDADDGRCMHSTNVPIP